MLTRQQCHLALTSLCLLLAVDTRSDVFYWGRNLDHGRNVTLAGKLGEVSRLDISVEEITRRLYDITGSYWKQEGALDYDLGDSGMEGNFGAAGLFLETAGRFFTFQFDSTLMQPEANPVAHHHYYIEVEMDIEYQGELYQHMKIPKDLQFKVDTSGGTMELRGLITPFTFEPVLDFRIIPWFDIGLFGFLDRYEIDAGPVQGVVQYQNPLEDFAVGGKSSGVVGMALPEWGGGGELRIGAPDNLNLVVQASATFCSLSGSSEMLTMNDHREKNIDIDHQNIRGRVLFQFPLKNAFCLTLGCQYQSIKSEGFITAKADTPEEILEMQERFDKLIRFRMDSLLGVIGFTF